MKKKNPMYLWNQNVIPERKYFVFFFLAPHISPLLLLFFFVGLKGKRVRMNEQKKMKKKT